MVSEFGSNWNEYITKRFEDKELFHLTMEWDDDKTSRTYCVTGARESSVEIYFGVDADGEIIDTVEFSRRDDMAPWSEFGMWEGRDPRLHFDSEEIQELENYLEIPLYRGWTEVDFFTEDTGVLYKTSMMFDTPRGRERETTGHRHLGYCLVRLLDKLSGVGFRLRRRTVPPIVRQQDQRSSSGTRTSAWPNLM